MKWNDFPAVKERKNWNNKEVINGTRVPSVA